MAKTRNKRTADDRSANLPAWWFHSGEKKPKRLTLHYRFFPPGTGVIAQAENVTEFASVVKLLIARAAEFSAADKNPQQSPSAERASPTELDDYAFLEASAISAVSELFTRATSGDARAASSLAKIAQDATLFTTMAIRIFPAGFSAAGKVAGWWPVLASSRADWPAQGRAVLEKIGFDGGPYRELNPEIAFDEDLPCRRWARAVYDVLCENRDRGPRWKLISNGMKSFLPEFKFTLDPVPAWAESAAALPLFARSTAKEWARLGREMIREEVPDFHDRPEFADFRRHQSNLDRNGKPSRGRLQNDILEKIGSSLASLARFASPADVAQGDMPKPGNEQRRRADGAGSAILTWSQKK